MSDDHLSFEAFDDRLNDYQLSDGSALSHTLLAGEDGFFARAIINEWMMMAAKNHGGEVFRIVEVGDGEGDGEED